MTVTAEEKLSRAIAGMVNVDSFWGYLFSHVQRTCAPDDFKYAMGIGPTSRGTLELIYNKDMILQTDNKTIELILEHEGWHILDKHILRRAKMLDDFGLSVSDMNEETADKDKVLKVINKKLFIKFLCDIHNQAADMSVNYLINAPDSLNIKTENSDVYTLVHARNQDPPLEDNKSTEYYFIELYKKYKDKCEAVGIGSLLDDHDGWDLGDTAEDNSLVSSKIESYIKKLVYNSYKHTRNRGNLPGKLKELIDSILSPPKIPYYQMIKRLIRASRISKIKRSPTKFNKKRSYAFYMHKNGKMDFLPYPGTRRDETFKLVIGIDTSGSMSGDACMEGLSASKSIIENDQNCYTTVLQCDTEVVEEYIIKKLSDIRFELKGRGGTRLAPMLKRAQELDCDVALIFTDAECEDFTKIPRSEMPKKVIWVIPHDANDSTIAGTGFIIRVDMQ